MFSRKWSLLVSGSYFDIRVKRARKTRIFLLEQPGPILAAIPPPAKFTK
jgi:hypothetical protein